MVAPSTLYSLAFSLVLGKCTCTILSEAKMVNRYLSNRLCKLYACYVSRMSCESMWRVIVGLTISTFRLNSRNYVRNRSTTDSPDNAFSLSSIRIDTPSEAHGGVSVTLHRSTASEFTRSKSEYDVRLTSEVPNLVRYLHLLAIVTYFS